MVRRVLLARTGRLVLPALRVARGLTDLRVLPALLVRTVLTVWMAHRDHLAHKALLDLSGLPAQLVLPVLLAAQVPPAALVNPALRVLRARTVLTGAGSLTRNAVTMAGGRSLGLTAPQLTAACAAHPHPSQELDHDDYR
jgi:hypothetical protein